MRKIITCLLCNRLRHLSNSFSKKFKNVKNLIEINKNSFKNTAENVVYFVEIIGFVKEI